MNSLRSVENRRLRLKRRIQRYRPAWQNLPEFEDWLKPHPNRFKAFCKFCSVTITADVNVIRKHSVSVRHSSIQEQYRKVKKNISKAKQVEIDSEDQLDSDFLSDEEEDELLEERDMIVTGNSDAHNFNNRTKENMCNSNSTEENINRPPCVTQSAPHFRGVAVINGQVTSIDLSDFRDRSYVILFFYPQDFNKICASEILAINERMAELKEMNVEVIGCSTDSHLAHLMWLNMTLNSGGIPNSIVPLLADPSHTICKKYGVYLPQAGHSLRAQFIIDHKGILRHMSINDALVGRGTDELIRIVKALQVVDETEEPLQANWKPPQK
ncbi:peroxiredoxin 1-like isoform X2 [Cimex lectularius]|nr:peroxiredoxin 1-like isoform X2 [Cimex lectularius]